MEKESPKEHKITVLIAGRPYPLRINAGEEPVIRKIVKEVNDHINRFQLSYTNRDKQDGLSMAVLTYAFDLYKTRQAASLQHAASQASDKLVEIDDLLDRLLA